MYSLQIYLKAESMMKLYSLFAITEKIRLVNSFSRFLVGFPDKNRPPTAFGMDADVPDDFPLFTVQIFDAVGIVATTGMLGTGRCV